MARVINTITRALEDHELRRDYRHQLTALMDQELARTTADRAIAKGEEKFSEFKKDLEKKQLEEVLKKYSKRSPKTEPGKSSTRYTLKGWEDGEPESFSGAIQVPPMPLSVAGSLNEPSQQNERKAGNSNLIQNLAGVWGQLLDERAILDKKIDKAKALISALEDEKNQELQPVKYKKLDPFAAGVLPRSASAFPKYQGFYPPVSAGEKELMGKLNPQWKYYDELPEEVETIELDERCVGYYRPISALRAEHEKILNQFNRRAGVEQVVSEWIDSSDISNAADNAAERI